MRPRLMTTIGIRSSPRELVFLSDPLKIMLSILLSEFVFQVRLGPVKIVMTTTTLRKCQTVVYIGFIQRLQLSETGFVDYENHESCTKASRCCTADGIDNFADSDASGSFIHARKPCSGTYGLRSEGRYGLSRGSRIGSV